MPRYREIIVYPMKTEYQIGGVTKSLDVAPKIENGRTLVPIRVISEGMGDEIDYGPKDGTPVQWVSVRRQRLPKIMIDPGHGGYDPGAIGKTGLQEKDVTLLVGFKVAAILAQAAEVRMTRYADIAMADDEETDLAVRAELANTFKADYFISIHCNSFDNANAYGTETYCYKFGGESEQLGRIVQAKLIEATGLTDRGLKAANFAVLRKTNMPAILVELGFISNSEEEALLESAEFQNTVARAIAEGIASYVGVILVV